MGVITDIKLSKTGDKARVYVDCEFCGNFTVDIAYKFDLKVGKEVDNDDLKQILFESERVKCTEYLIAYLDKYPTSERHAREKLKEKGYPQLCIDHSVTVAKDYGYINDCDYAARYVESKIQTSGARKIKFELGRLGIASSVIEEILSDYDADDIKDNAMTLARKWWLSRDIDERSDKEKFMRYMSSRGFEWSVTSYCIDAIKREEIDEE